MSQAEIRAEIKSGRLSVEAALRDGRPGARRMPISEMLALGPSHGTGRAHGVLRQAGVSPLRWDRKVDELTGRELTAVLAGLPDRLRG